MAHHLLNVSPTSVVITDLAEQFHFKSEHTAKNYVSYLKQAFLLSGVKKYSRKSKVRITQEKVYAVDVAMLNQRKDAFSGDNLGWRLETIVLAQLLRKCNVEGWDVYYMLERSGECDFIICKGDAVLLAVQVAYDISAQRTRQREINGALKVTRRQCGGLLVDGRGLLGTAVFR